MKQYTASIICPVRDEVLTLAECLDSLLKQTYSYKEIIVVDDESTDGSSEIIEEYAKKYPKNKSVHYKTRRKLYFKIKKHSRRKI